MMSWDEIVTRDIVTKSKSEILFFFLEQIGVDMSIKNKFWSHFLKNLL